MYKIEKQNLTALFRKIAEGRDLYLPVESAGQVNFAAWDEEAKVSLDTTKTVKSPKDAFFPQSETLYTCKKEGKKLEVTQEALREKGFVVFGMKACDVRGVEVLDRVFLSEPVDSYYQARREHGVLVALACKEPEESCFCTAFGIDAANPVGADAEKPAGDHTMNQTGADVAVWDIADWLYWKPLTEKGEALTESVRGLLTEAGEEEVLAEQSRIRAVLKRLPYADLSLEGWGGDATKEKFDSPLWETLYRPCLGCGTCTFVCPTCQCYDIKDYRTKDGIQRYRCWDSCMYSDFTLMSAGNNRTTQLQRFRQRFMHKLVYYPANNDGLFSCTGCGRCVEKCPSSLNIVKVIKAFAKEGGARNE